ncbi:MAG TPA: PKD domain-containing protein [Polyangiaceae bacterium]
MKLLRAASLAAATSLLATPALALELSAEPAAPVPIGAPHTFRITEVKDAEGAVTYRWTFGDGTVVGPGAGAEVEHTYQAAGHYTVIVIGTDAAGNRSSASWEQTANPPLTALPPSNSSSVVFDPVRRRIWSVNQDSHSVSVTATDTLMRVLEVPVGTQPRMLAQAPDGAIWVTNQGSDEIVVLDPDSGAEHARLALPYASQPHSLAFGPGGKAYVSLFASGELVEVDAASLAIGRHLALGPTPAGVSVAADGRIFVTRFISPEEHGEVWVVAPGSFSLVRTIELAMDPGPDSESAGRGVPNFVSSVVISPDGTQAWVTAKKDDVVRGPQRDGLSMNPDNFVRALVCVLDLASEAEVMSKRMDVDNRALPASLAFSPVGDMAYLLLQGSNWVGIFDAYAAQSVSGIKDIGKAPDGLAFSNDGKLFVNSWLTRELFVYDLTESLASRDHQAPPPLAQIASVSLEPLSAQLLLGKQVFYDAADKRMSEVGYMSCATCHIYGLSDGRVWDFTDRGEGLRNTKSLLGVGSPGQGRVHWSANFDEIQDFERDIRESLGGTGFMPEADWLARMGDTFGMPMAGVSPELDALAAYVLSLSETPRSPFRNPDGSFTEAALRGRVVFESAGCAVCHAAPTFTNSDTGTLFDVGTRLPTSGHRLGGDLTGFDTPTLKGLWQSAPYLHDGRAATLEQVFEITGDAMGITSSLSAEEKSDLVRYLQELDDVPETAPRPDPEPPPAAPMSAEPRSACTLATGGATGSEPFALAALASLLALVLLRRN